MPNAEGMNIDWKRRRADPKTDSCPREGVPMDYDQTEIATAYDKARVLAPETARLWLDLLAPYINQAAASLIIDLGCGTGRFSDLLATHFGCQVIGIDPSRKMIDQARHKPASGNVNYRQGPAEAMPLPDGC